VIAGVSAVIAIVACRFSRRASISIGDGFMPFDSDLGWPRGVQEDDDVHWRWADGRRT
jgi:hypothetical protein